MSASAMPPSVNRQPNRCDMRIAQIGARKAKESPMAMSQSRSSQRIEKRTKGAV